MQASDQSSTFPTMPQLTIPCLSRGDWGTQPIPVTPQLEKNAILVSVLANKTLVHEAELHQLLNVTNRWISKMRMSRVVKTCCAHEAITL